MNEDLKEAVETLKAFIDQRLQIERRELHKSLDRRFAAEREETNRQFSDLHESLDRRFAAERAETNRQFTHSFTELHESLDLRFTVEREETKRFVLVQIEQLRDDFRSVSNGYRGSMGKIERELKELREELLLRLSDHDAALRDHLRRISALEARK